MMRDESETPNEPYDLSDVKAHEPPADIDDDKTKAEERFYEKEAKALGNVRTALIISLIKVWIPKIIWIVVAWYVICTLCIIASAARFHGFVIPTGILIAMLGVPAIVGLIGLATQMLKSKPP